MISPSARFAVPQKISYVPSFKQSVKTKYNISCIIGLFPSKGGNNNLLWRTAYEVNTVTRPKAKPGRALFIG